jgi:hypothetical protein
LVTPQLDVQTWNNVEKKYNVSSNKLEKRKKRNREKR